jgi:hypothetical protein
MIESAAISLNNLCRERPTHYGVVASEGRVIRCLPGLP